MRFSIGRQLDCSASLIRFALRDMTVREFLKSVDKQLSYVKKRHPLRLHRVSCILRQKCTRNRSWAGRDLGGLGVAPFGLFRVLRWNSDVTTRREIAFSDSAQPAEPSRSSDKKTPPSRSEQMFFRP